MTLTRKPRARTWPLPTTAAILALLVLPLALAPRADAYVYWTGQKGIGRANLDGSGVDQSFITGVGDPASVAVDVGHIYWANFDADTIGRADLDGTDVDQSFITGAIGPTGVALDAGHVYWANQNANTIGRASLDGTGVNQSFITGSPATYTQGQVRAVAVDANHVYWTWIACDTGVCSVGSHDSAIGRADLDGTGVIQSFITGASDSFGVAVDAGHVYWTNNPAVTIGRTIGRSDLDGTDADQSFITGASDPYDVAVHANHVYWANYYYYSGQTEVRARLAAPTHVGTIGRANLDGTDADQSFITGARLPRGVAVDADATPPQTKITKGAPSKTNKTKVKFKFKSSEPDSTFECKLDKKPFKPCESPKKVKRLKEGKHKFQVRAIDAAGNVDPSAAKDKFKVVD